MSQITNTPPRPMPPAASSEQRQASASTSNTTSFSATPTPLPTLPATPLASSPKPGGDMVSPGISPHLAPLTVAQQMFTIPGAVHAIIMTEEPPSLLPGVTNMATPLAAEVLAPPQALAQNMVSDTVRVDKKRPPEGAPDASDAQAHRDKRSRLDKTASNGDEHST